MEPMLYDNPSSLPLATKAVITSPAPFASANKVTAAIGSDNPSHSEIYEIDGARYSSTTADINLKINRISMNDSNKDNIQLPDNQQ